MSHSDQSGHPKAAVRTHLPLVRREPRVLTPRTPTQGPPPPLPSKAALTPLLPSEPIFFLLGVSALVLLFP